MTLVTGTLQIRTSTGLHGRIGMRLIGPLDAGGATVLIDEISRRGPGPGDHLVLHLEDVTILEPTGVNALAYVEAFVRSRGGQVSVRGSNAGITHALALAGMERLLLVGGPVPAIVRGPQGDG
jgi:anti-anti-sigma regulatory factor